MRESAQFHERIDRARGAGSVITCVNYDGKGYVIRGWGERRPYECNPCQGKGVQTITKSTLAS